MSIYIGNSPPENIKTNITDNVLTISTNNSNVVDFSSINDNVLLTIGDYTIGQYSNISTNFEKEFQINNIQEKLLSLSDSNTLFQKNVVFSSNLSITGNIIINNDLSMDNITVESSISMIDNSIINTNNIETSNLLLINNSNELLLQVFNCNLPIAYLSNKDNGQLYINSSVGIGTIPHNGYSIYTESNINIDKTFNSCNIYTNFIEYNNLSKTGIYMTDKVLKIGSEDISTQTFIDNFTIGDSINLTTVNVSDFISIDNKLFSSNITITNNRATLSPLKIVSEDINTTIPVIKVLSEYSSNNNIHTSNIFTITSKGHIIMGIYSEEDTNINEKDYMLRADIDELRTQYFNGLLHFTNSNIYQNTTISQDGYIGIGNSNITSMLEIKNNLYGNENTTIPENFIHLENKLSSNTSLNKLPFIKCITNDNIMFEITSNGSLIFNDIQVDTNEYNIAASNIKTYNLDTQNINTISGVPISFEYNTLSNITDIYATGLYSSNAIIYNRLNVGSINIASREIIPIEDYGIITIHIIADRLFTTSENIAIGVPINHYSLPENRLDTLYINTDEIPSNFDIQALYIEGSNDNIRLTINNSNNSIYTGIGNNSTSLNQYIVNNNYLTIEAINRDIIPNQNSYLLIHSGDTNTAEEENKIGISILKNNDVSLTQKVIISKDGYLTIGIEQQNTGDRIFIKDSVNIINTEETPTFTIKNDGRVGFATDTPYASMYLHNTLGYEKIVHIYDENCNITPFIIDNNGNVGLGTDNTTIGRLTINDGDILPLSDIQYNLGNINYRWNNSNLYNFNYSDIILGYNSSNGLIIKSKINDYIPFQYTSNNINYEFYTNSNNMINEYFNKDYINLTKNDSDLYYNNGSERIVGDWNIANTINSNLTCLTASCWSSNHSQFIALGESFIGLNRYKRLGYHNEGVDYVTIENSIETIITKDKIDFFHQMPYPYSYLFTGYFVPSSTGEWTFSLDSDDGSYMWIGNNALSGYTTGNAFINNGGLHGLFNTTNTINLIKGVSYPIRILFGDNAVAGGLLLSFSGPDTELTNDISKHFRTGYKNIAYTSKDGKSWSNINLLEIENDTNIYNSICWSKEKEKYVAVGNNYYNNSNAIIINSDDSINWSYGNTINNALFNYNKFNEVIYSSDQDLFIVAGENYKSLYDNYTLLYSAINTNTGFELTNPEYIGYNEFLLTSNVESNIYEFLLSESNDLLLQPFITSTVYWEHPEPLHNRYAISFDMYVGNGTGGDYLEIRFNTSNYNEYYNNDLLIGSDSYSGYVIRFDEYINNNENRISLFKKTEEVSSTIGLYDIDDSTWRTMKIYYQYDSINDESEINLTRFIRGNEEVILSYVDTSPILNPSTSYISFNSSTSNATNEHTIRDIYYYSSSNIITSIDGNNWTIRDTELPYEIKTICWSPEMSLYVAITTQKAIYNSKSIITSSDTINWSIQKAPTNVTWNSICWSKELGIFVAVGSKCNNNGVITSSNGIDWTQRYCPNGGWNKVIWIAEFKQFVAIGEGNEIMISIDGIYWTTKKVSYNRWNDICWSSELYRYLSIGYNTVISEEVVTNIPGLMAWYTGKSWNGTIWEDISGNDNHCTDIRGTINTVSKYYIYGGVNDGIRFPTNILPNNYTLFHVARYNGVSKRIFDGVNSNWLSGFWDGYSGVAYHGEFITNLTGFGSKIIVSTDQRKLYRANGIDRTKGSVNPTAYDRLSINYGAYTYSGTESSVWIVFEVIVYDRELPLSEIKLVEEYLRKKYDNLSEYSINDYTTKALISGNPNPKSNSFGLDLYTGAGGLNVTAPVVNKELAWTTLSIPGMLSGIQYRGICWSPELKLIVSIGAYNTSNICVSSNGRDWTIIQNTPEAINAWEDIIWVKELELFIAVAQSGTNRVLTSPDGYNWTTVNVPLYNWDHICWSPELSLLVSSTYNDSVVMISSNGISWTTHSTVTGYGMHQIIWVSELGLFVGCCYVAADNAKCILTSPDGITWTLQNTPNLGYSRWTAIAWSPELSLLVVTQRDNGNKNLVSSDGINWKYVHTPALSVEVIWCPELHMFIGSGSLNNTNKGSYTYSFDGYNWQSGIISDNNNIWGMVWIPELAILIGFNTEYENKIAIAECSKTNKTVLSVKDDKVFINNALGIGTEPSNASGLIIKQPIASYFANASGNSLLHSPGIELISDTIKHGIFINHNQNLGFISGNLEDNYKGVSGWLINANNNTQMNFTGQHRCFVDSKSYEELQNMKGLIVSANKNNYRNMSGGLITGNKAITINESLPVVSLTTKSKDREVFGVISTIEDIDNRYDNFGSFVTPYEKIKGDTRAYINSVGEGAIWVSNKNGSLLSGSYVTSSDIPGYGEKQQDYILHNYTVAKITMDCDFNPKLVPVKRIKRTEVIEDNNIGSNIITIITNDLDEYGNIILEDTEELEYEYQLRYILENGTIITEDEYNKRMNKGEQVYKAAFIGCTYHCG